ncbi:minor capsid protein [Streptomyces sp. NPDC057555]|uniref:minor capsid protein n=1 Tax=Streptomyces sp. NPDC057555 TaxID=3346166 RepID=UPI00367A4E00
MSYTADLLDGLARLLAEHGVGAYRPDGRYAPGDAALTIAAVPPAPDRVICLSAYPVQDSPALTDCITGIQVRTRAGADPREVDALDDAVFDVLHGAGPFLWGAARVQLLYRTMSAPIGADDAGRMERTSTYYARAHRATQHLE